MSEKTTSMKAQRRLVDTILYIVLFIVAMFWLAPFAVILLTSVRSMGDLINNGVFAWPEAFVWTNFSRAWNIGNFSTYFRNSLTLIVLKVPLGIVIAA